MRPVLRCLAASLCLAVATPSLSAGLCLEGVNLSGAEYGTRGGVHGTDYIYPTDPTIAYFAGLGMNVVRLPFRWERLQPVPGEKLDADELRLLGEAVDRIQAAGMDVILDPHNFGYYDKKRIGDGLDPVFFADFWARVAAEFANRPGLHFGLMNEPHDVPADVWAEAANGAIASIRTVGADNWVLVPGTLWTGAHSWSKPMPGGSNAEAMATIRDPRERTAIEFHQYMDEDYSGTHAPCSRAAEAQKAIAHVSDWLRKTGNRGFLGEFGGSKEEACLAGIEKMVETVRNNGDVWLGWSYWAGGDWWPEDEILTEGKPQAKILARLLAAQPPARGRKCLDHH